MIYKLNERYKRESDKQIKETILTRARAYGDIVRDIEDLEENRNENQ